MFTLFESKNDKTEAEEYIQVYGVDEFWSSISTFLKNGISENFIKSLLKMPKDHKIIASIGSELADSGKLSVISDFILSNDSLAEEVQIIPLKLKILCEQSDDELFLTLMKYPQVSSIIFEYF